MLVRVVGMLFGLVLMIILARLLAPAEFGDVTVAFSVALTGGLLTTLNIGAGAVRFLTGFVVRGDSPAAAAYLAHGRARVTNSGLFLWLVLATIALAGFLGWLPQAPIHLLVGLAAAPVFGWLRINAAYVAALGQVVRAALPNTLIRPALMAILVAIAYFVLDGLDSVSVLGLYLLTALTVAIIQKPVFRRALSPMIVDARHASGDERRQWTRVGLDLLIPTLFLELSVDTIIIIASVILSAEQIAILAIVLRIQAIILFGVTSINMIVGPRIATAHSSGDRQAVEYLLLASAHLKLWPSLMTLGLLALLGHEVLGVFGPEYEAHVAPLLILSLTPILMAVFGPVVLFITILGLQKQGTRVFRSAIALLTAMILVLGYFFGVNGVAVAVVSVWIFWNFRLYTIIHKHSGYNTLQPRYGFRIPGSNLP